MSSSALWQVILTAFFRHTPCGTQLLKNFAAGICGAQTNWTMSNFIDQEIARIRNLVGPKGQVLGAVVRSFAFSHTFHLIRY